MGLTLQSQSPMSTLGAARANTPSMPFDVLDLLAVIVGVLHTVRKLDVMKRRAQDFPHVAPADFADWQERERAAYALGSWACFAKILLDPALWLLAPKLELAPTTMRILAASIDLGWFALVMLAMLRASRARRRRNELGIALYDPHQSSS